MDAVHLCGLLEYIDVECDNDTVLKKRANNKSLNIKENKIWTR